MKCLLLLWINLYELLVQENFRVDCFFRMNFPPSSEDHQLYDMDQPPPQGNSGPPPGPPGGDGMNYGGGGYGAGGGGNMMSSKEQALMWQQVSHN